LKRKIEIELIKRNDSLILDTLYSIVPYEKIKINRESPYYRDLFKLRMISDYSKPEIFLVPWTELENYNPNYTDLYIVNGKAFFDLNGYLRIYQKAIDYKIKNYILSLKDKLKEADFEIYVYTLSLLRELYGETVYLNVEAQSLNSSAFPPCVLNVLNGVGEGIRNYGLVMLLAPFLAYSRFFPSTRSLAHDFHATIDESHIQILNDEIIPIILAAGENCSPPFFKDNSIDIVNYHLGFGMNTIISLSLFGKSKLYAPPSCKNIQTNAGVLCTPDCICKETFYRVANEKVFSKYKDTTKTLDLLYKLQKPKSLTELLGYVDEAELKRFLLRMTRNKDVDSWRLTNPLTYYVRKKLK